MVFSGSLFLGGSNYCKEHHTEGCSRDGPESSVGTMKATNNFRCRRMRAFFLSFFLEIFFSSSRPVFKPLKSLQALVLDRRARSRAPHPTATRGMLLKRFKVISSFKFTGKGAHTLRRQLGDIITSIRSPNRRSFRQSVGTLLMLFQDQLFCEPRRTYCTGRCLGVIEVDFSMSRGDRLALAVSLGIYHTRSKIVRRASFGSCRACSCLSGR